MKNIILFLMLLSLGTIIAQPQHRGHLNPLKLDSVEVSGKVIVKAIVKDTITRNRYYLDTNSDGVAEYYLDFGPSWYKPANSAAVHPVNGETVKILGGKFVDLKDSVSVIVVYQINGLFWRDPFFAEWNDVGKRDSLKGGFVHRKDSTRRGYGVGPRRDSIVTQTLTGIALVDTTLRMDRYFLDTDGDAVPNYILNFGPFWYKPKSGAVRPLDGEKITIVAGILGAKTKYPMAIVYEINGKVWRDSIVLHVSVGGKWFSANNSTKIHSMYDSDDYIQVQQGKLDNRMMNEYAAQLLESYPENTPAYKGQNMFAAYELSIYDNQGNDYMWNFGRAFGKMQMSSKASLQFHYTDEQLAFYGLAEDNLKVKAWSDYTNSWLAINASVNTSTNTVKIETNNLSNYYAIVGSTTTDIALEESLPAGYDLKQNYPNPFNPETVISYQLPVASYVTLKIYDVLGNEVATLVNEFKQPGIYNSQLSIRNYKLTSGVYFYKLQAGNFTSTKKMMLIK